MKNFFITMSTLICCLPLLSCKSKGAQLEGINTSDLRVNYIREFLPKNCQPDKNSPNGEIQLYTNQENSNMAFVTLDEKCIDPADTNLVNPDNSTPTINLTESVDLNQASQPEHVLAYSNWCKMTDQYAQREYGAQTFPNYTKWCSDYIRYRSKELTNDATKLFKQTKNRWLLVTPIGIYNKDGLYHKVKVDSRWFENPNEEYLQSASSPYEALGVGMYGQRVNYDAKQQYVEHIRPDDTGLQLIFIYVSPEDESAGLGTLLTKSHTYRFKIQN